MEENIYYIWLNSACGAGSQVSGELLKLYGTAENIYNLSPKELESLEQPLSIRKENLNKLNDKNLSRSEKIYAYCIKNNISVINCNEEIFPLSLKKIRSNPVLLYCRGIIKNINESLCIAMVGTRKMSPYGKSAAYHLAFELARKGAVIISGMAEGIDAASHWGALNAGGYTVAVLGSGIDVIYPPKNKELFEKLVGGGLVVTEYDPRTEPLRTNFPVRNRLISGLAQAVTVVEADKKSGSLITAKAGLFQGKDLFAVPGDINKANSGGVNDLIKNGANIVTCADDILSEYEYLYSIKSNIIPENSREYGILNKTRAKNKISSEGTFPNHVQSSAESPRPANPVNIISNVKSAAVRETKHDFTEKQSAGKEAGSSRADMKLNIEQKLMALEVILNENESRIFSVISENADKPIHPDDFAGRGIPVNEIISLLSILEIYGIVVPCPGDKYKLSDVYLSDK